MQARKPDFFTYNMSLYQIVTEDGLMRPCMVAKKGGLFCGGSARMVEKALELEGDDILYVGDHVSWDTLFPGDHVPHFGGHRVPGISVGPSFVGAYCSGICYK